MGDDHTLREAVARAICVAMKLDPDRQYPAAKEWEAMSPAADATLAAVFAFLVRREVVEAVALAQAMYHAGVVYGGDVGLQKNLAHSVAPTYLPYAHAAIDAIQSIADQGAG